MKELTEKQQSAWDLRESGMSFTEVSEQMGCRRQEAYTHYRGALKKKDRDKRDEEIRKMEPRPQANEHVRPVETAKLFDAFSSPEKFHSLEEIAKEVGLPAVTVAALKKRLERQYLPVKLELKRIRTEEFQKRIDGTALWILNSVDEFDLLRASLKDKVSAFCMLMEKRQLLSGEPTQILSINERKEITDLIPLLMKEATRRGLIIDIDPATGEAVAT